MGFPFTPAGEVEAPTGCAPDLTLRLVHDALFRDWACLARTGDLIEFSGRMTSRYKFALISNGTVQLVEVAGKRLLRYTLRFKAAFYVPVLLAYVFAFYLGANVSLLMSVAGTAAFAVFSWAYFYVAASFSFEYLLRGALLSAPD
jgi:hypothetical protein